MLQEITRLQALGATNFRINQKQVNVMGKLVGNNRPDLQYDLNDLHFAVELDKPLKSGSTESVRGLPHFLRILANDPSLSKAQLRIETVGNP
ncbi:hypothetical protein M1D89_01810 (plasmid) [Arthrobacter sp. D3-18]